MIKTGVKGNQPENLGRVLPNDDRGVVGGESGWECGCFPICVFPKFQRCAKVSERDR